MGVRFGGAYRTAALATVSSIKLPSRPGPFAIIKYILIFEYSHQNNALSISVIPQGRRGVSCKDKGRIVLLSSMYVFTVRLQLRQVT